MRKRFATSLLIVLVLAAPSASAGLDAAAGACVDRTALPDAPTRFVVLGDKCTRALSVGLFFDYTSGTLTVWVVLSVAEEGASVVLRCAAASPLSRGDLADCHLVAVGRDGAALALRCATGSSLPGGHVTTRPAECDPTRYLA